MTKMTKIAMKMTTKMTTKMTRCAICYTWSISKEEWMMSAGTWKELMNRRAEERPAFASLLAYFVSVFVVVRPATIR